MTENKAKVWRINFYQTLGGDWPVKDFIARQNPSIRSRVAHFIILLQNQGPYLKPPYMKKLQNKLYELRITTQPQIRILYTIQSSEYYLLHAFKKKTQKIPLKELKLAIDRMKGII